MEGGGEGGSSWVETLATGSRFVSEKQLEEERQQYGGTTRAPPADGPTKPLWEQLKANKDRAEEDFQELIRFRTNSPIPIYLIEKLQIKKTNKKQYFGSDLCKKLEKNQNRTTKGSG